MRSTAFFVRVTFTALVTLGILAGLWGILFGRNWGIFFLLAAMALGFSIASTFSHIHRVRLMGEDTPLGSRHRRQIEMPLPAAEAFAIVDSAVRELPGVESVESIRDSLQVTARVIAVDSLTGIRKSRKKDDDDVRRNRVRATVAARDATSSLTLLCEPETGAWIDLFMTDQGANYENMEAVTRAVTRRLAERRRTEEAQVRDTATDKELAVAKLSLLHAQVEPHFLYNTLANAQVLTRSDPARADQMLGNLIVYLRHSLPSTDDSLSTLGDELERARAYLEILKIRMGDRLTLQLQVPETLNNVPLPPMMLQTLVENSIKHGLESQPRGGNVWIFAREAGANVSVIVADDGRGLHEGGGGTGVGLKNVRERLRLIYGDAASFTIAANFPSGVAATITVPKAGPAVAPKAGGTNA
jgi:hypothetical protein